MCVIRVCYNYIMEAKGVEGKRLCYRDFMSGLQVCGPRPRNIGRGQALTACDERLSQRVPSGLMV